VSGLKVAIADDEPLARHRLRALLQRGPGVTVVAESRNGEELLAALASTHPDVVFLDVQMPGGDGLSIIERLPAGDRPQVVLVTAYDRYAVRAFDLDAVDYLLKPYDDERFGVALERARTAVLQRSGDAVVRALGLLDKVRGHATTEYLSVRGPRGTVLVAVESVDWIESADNYVQIYAGAERHLVRMTLAELERRLPASEFARVHRRAIVNIRRVRELRPSTHGDFHIVLRSGDVVPLSRRYRSALEKQLGIEL
jgi:two-component system LytT family response regulator